MSFFYKACARMLIYIPSVLSGQSLGKYSLEKDVVYTPADWPEAVRADVYSLVGSGSAPAVLLIHGGSWAGNDNRYQMRSIAKRLAGRGYVVMNATYRGAPKWVFPAPVDDLRQALCWMRDNSKELNIDAERMAVYGYSAGGHLAEMVGFQKPPEGLSIRAIIAGATPHDLTLAPDFPVVTVFLGKTFKEQPELYSMASPMNNVVPESPPLFIYQGMKDKLVPPEHTYRLIPKLEKNKIRYEIYWLKRRGHLTTFLFSDNAICKAIKFLDKELMP